MKSLKKIHEYTNLFEKKSFLAFPRWRLNNTALFLRAKNDRNKSNRKRELYVVNDIYHGRYYHTAKFEQWLIHRFLECISTSIIDYLFT